MLRPTPGRVSGPVLLNMSVPLRASAKAALAMPGPQGARETPGLPGREVEQVAGAVRCIRCWQVVEGRRLCHWAGSLTAAGHDERNTALKTLDAEAWVCCGVSKRAANGGPSSPPRVYPGHDQAGAASSARALGTLYERQARRVERRRNAQVAGQRCNGLCDATDMARAAAAAAAACEV